MKERPLRPRLSARPIVFVASAVGATIGLFGSGFVSPVAATSPPPPTIVSVSPQTGPASGGTQVIVTGKNLAGGPRVYFGEQEATTVRSGDTYKVIAPPGLSGTTVDVNFSGYSYDGRTNVVTFDDFTYAGRTRAVLTATPDHGAPEGGGQVSISGSGVDFSDAVSAKIGGTDAPIVSKTTSAVTVTVPRGVPASLATLSVTHRDGHTDGTLWRNFTYDFSNEPPVITSPTSWSTPSNQGGSIRLSGRGLEGATGVTIGGKALSTFYRSGHDLDVYFSAGQFAPGNYPLIVTTPAGTSAATPFTVTVVDALVPVIDSFSPRSGPISSGTVVTVRGKNLDRVDLVELYAYPSWQNYRARGTIISATPTELKFTTAVGYNLGENEIRLETPNAFGETDQYTAGDGFTYLDGGEIEPTPEPTPESTPTPEPTPTPTPTPTPQPTPEPPLSATFGLAGSASLKTLTKGSLPLSGSLSVLLQPVTGNFSGSLAMAPATGNLTALGFLPVVAKVNLVPTDSVSGTIKDGKLSAVAKVRIKLPSVKALGIELAGGANCQAKQISSITLASTQPNFTFSAGGPVAGSFGISDLSGCGFLTGIVSPLTKGNGNTIALNLTR